MVFSKKEPQVLASEIADDIKKAIINGDIRPGERIVESQIAKEMGISRSPVREAIRELSKKGILITIPYKGTYVNLFEEKDIDDIYSLRVVFEDYAIEELIKKYDKKVLQKLKNNIQEMKIAFKKENVQQLIQKDLEFHRIICYFTNNKKLIEIWNAFETQLEVLLNYEGTFFYERHEITITEHEIIISLIEAKKMSAIKKKMKEHILQSRNFLKKNLKLLKASNRWEDNRKFCQSS